MGINQDHFMWVSANEDNIQELHAQAVKIFQEYELGKLVSPVMPSVANGYASFFIAPDGSKDGWDTSDDGDKARAKLIEKLEDNNAPWCDWMEVTTGEISTHITKGSMIFDDADDE